MTDAEFIALLTQYIGSPGLLLLVAEVGRRMLRRFDELDRKIGSLEGRVTQLETTVHRQDG